MCSFYLHIQFQKFNQTYRQENEVELADNFKISSQAVKNNLVFSKVY